MSSVKKRYISVKRGAMKKIIFASGLCFSVIGSAWAQTVNLGGTVTNSAGKPIAGAEVTLIRLSLKDTTNADGVFKIRQSSSLVSNFRNPVLPDSRRGYMEVFNAAGKLTETYQFINGMKMPRVGLNAGIHLARLTIGDTRRTVRFVATAGREGKSLAFSSFRGEIASGASGLVASAAAGDSLRVVRASYRTTVVAVNSLLDSNIAIRLDTNVSAQAAGCGKSFTRPDPAVKQTLNVSGSSRTYQVFIPTSYSSDKQLPLIFALHGGGGNAAGARSDYKLEAATNNAAIIVYPESPFWNYGSGNDMAFFDALLADLKNRYCIDTRKVFATGFSLGGIFVNGIGCIYGGGAVRGIMPVAGSGPNPNMGPASEADIACPAGKPTGDVAVLIIHGTADGNANYKYAQWEANYWSKWNGCSTTAVSGTAPFDGCKIYEGCRAPVYFYTHSGGHMVPGNAGTLIWEFIKKLD